MTTLAGKRLKLHQLMAATLLDRHNWTYAEVRPMPVPATWQPGNKVHGDCSKGVQYLCHWAQAPDPMQNGWGVWGNSTTIWLTLHHVATARELAVGDIVVFGPQGNAHAAMVYEAGADPLLWSFGHQGAPDTYRLSADQRERTFCKLPLTPPPPPPADKLRAMTGYYAWISWKLGEGPWRDYPRAAKIVRPHVPKLIPPRWWRAYALFLKNRKRGH